MNDLVRIVENLNDANLETILERMQSLLTSMDFSVIHHLFWFNMCLFWLGNIMAANSAGVDLE